jgi:hypothetical protein
MQAFKDYVNESRIHRAIYLFDGNESKAEKYAKKVFDWLENEDNNSYVTIEAVNVVEGDTDNDSIIHVVGYAQATEAKWKKLNKKLSAAFKELEFERFA